ncbi:MAG: hypothetical protein RBT47_04360 [Anaerolineae bacterium]|nr:hypothetical protein [Anaerolineae bacterium]
MLTLLLRQMAKEGTLHSPEALAHTLNVTPELIVQMAEHLTRQGYLNEISQCTTGCTSCPVQALCKPEGNRPRLWMLTTKGQRALKE